jgi:hypothetical protein
MLVKPKTILTVVLTVVSNDEKTEVPTIAAKTAAGTPRK